MLERAFVKSLMLAEREALFAQMYALLGATDPGETSLLPPSGLSDPRFSTAGSGLYASIRSSKQSILWQSDSLALSEITFLEAFNEQLPNVTQGIELFNEIQLGQQAYFYLSLGTVWTLDNGDQNFQFTILHTKENLEKEIHSYRTALVFWLFGLAVILIGVQIIVVRWGLSPLNVLAKEIKSIEAGKKAALENAYPLEIDPVTKNINLLLESEKVQRERYKNTLGDLAHSLKTPLAIIRSQIESLTDVSAAEQINDQVESMSNIVRHQLNRATSSIQKTYLSPVDIKHICERIVGALKKVYRDKNLTINLHISDSIYVLAEKDDLLEVFGNIIENACKYSASQVSITAQTSPDTVNVLIEDDGPGIEESQKQQVLERGARLDTSLPGQGIGLSVALDILSSYNAGLKIETSELGGAKFIVSLPK